MFDLEAAALHTRAFTSSQAGGAFVECRVEGLAKNSGWLIHGYFPPPVSNLAVTVGRRRGFFPVDREFTPALVKLGLETELNGMDPLTSTVLSTMLLTRLEALRQGLAFSLASGLIKDLAAVETLSARFAGPLATHID